MAGDLGVGLEFVVVAVGEIGTVMAAAAFFAGQGAAGDENAEGVKVFEFVIAAAIFVGERNFHSFQGVESGFEFLAVAEDADLLPHHFTEFLKSGRGGRLGFLCDGRGVVGFAEFGNGAATGHVELLFPGAGCVFCHGDAGARAEDEAFE